MQSSTEKRAEEMMKDWTPRFRWATLDCFDGPRLVAWCEQKYIVWEALESPDALVNESTRVWPEGNVWEVFWTMVALRSSQGQCRTILWSSVAKRSGQWLHYGLIRDQSLDTSCTKIWPQSNNWQYIFDCSFYHCFWWLKRKVAGTSKWLFVYIFIN